MKLKKLFIYTFAILITTLLFVRLTSTAQSAQPVPNYRLNTIINQATDTTLTLTSIGLEEGPYVSYAINYPDNYFVIKIIDTNNTELFSGKTPSVYQSLPPDFVSVPNFTPETIIANPINLYLPYFNEATKVQLFDQTGKLKLEISLANHNLVGLKYRYAACDLCGYCPPDKLPSNWEKCRLCLYLAANPTPTMGDTLRITDPSSNTGPTPNPGYAYTGIGCIKIAPSKNTQMFLNIIFSIIGGVAFLYLLYGALVIMTSQANEEKLRHGRQIVIRAIVGVIFSLLSVFIVNSLASGVLKIPGFN